MPATAEQLKNLAKARAAKKAKGAKRGKGLLDTIKSGISKVKTFAKQNKLISKSLSGLANSAGPGLAGTLLRYGSTKAQEAGYGRKLRMVQEPGQGRGGSRSKLSLGILP